MRLAPLLLDDLRFATCLKKERREERIRRISGQPRKGRARSVSVFHRSTVNLGPVERCIHPLCIPRLSTLVSERTPRAFGVLVIPDAAGIGPPGLLAVPYPPSPLPRPLPSSVLLARPNQSRLILRRVAVGCSWPVDRPHGFFVVLPPRARSLVQETRLPS